MKTFFKILCVLFVIASVGQLIGGNIFPLGIILAIVFGYFGWREKKEPELDEVA